jgi:hypothetical protein
MVDHGVRNGLSLDVNKRDAILFGRGYEPKQYLGGIRRFDNVTAGGLRLLLKGGFLDLYDAQNNSPTAREFLRFVEEHPKFTVFGYAVSPDRDDYRVTIEGCETGKILSAEDVADFSDKFSGANEFSVSQNGARCWYD